MKTIPHRRKCHIKRKVGKQVGIERDKAWRDNENYLVHGITAAFIAFI